MPTLFRKTKILGYCRPSTTMSSPTRLSILDLPEELIVLIIEHIDDSRSLRRLIRSCRQLQRLAEPVLYRNILTRSNATTRMLQHAFESRLERVQALQNLRVPCEHRSPPNFATLAWIMRSAQNLRCLMFESPECNTSRFEDVEDYDYMAGPLLALFGAASLSPGRYRPAYRPLQRLQKLTLHMNGPNSPYWKVDADSIHIFLHPTLREIHLSCVTIDELPAQFNPPEAHITPLQTLKLEECNITNNGLIGILRLPKALRTLYLGENCHNRLHFRNSAFPLISNHLFERNAPAAAAALQLQKHSLQRFTYVTAPQWYETADAFGCSSSSATAATHVEGAFADFQALEHVELRGYCPRFERAVFSMQPPPNLQSLAFKGKKLFRKASRADLHNTDGEHGQDVLGGIPFLRAPSASVPPSLREMDITYTSEGGIMIVDLITSSSLERSFIRDAAKVLRDMGVELRVRTTRTEGDNWYFPPFLYGESAPPEDMVFEKGEFVGTFKASERRLSRVSRVLSTFWRNNGTAMVE